MNQGGCRYYSNQRIPLYYMLLHLYLYLVTYYYALDKY